MGAHTVHHICIFKQGTHCTKIGSKCVEERWFNDGQCLIAERKRYQYGREIPVGVPAKPDIPEKPEKCR